MEATATNTFRNPVNDYAEKISGLSWLWCLAFGPIFWAFKGQWKHALIMLGFNVLTGLSAVGPLFIFPREFIAPFLSLVWIISNWIVYPLKAREILRRSYLRRGWVPA